MAENKNLDEMINNYKNIIEKLEAVKDSGEEEQNNAIKDAMLSGYCCGSCVAISSICTPDSTPNKCKGGCTATSFAF